MANTISSTLVADAYAALDIVGQEAVGAIPAVTLLTDLEAVPVGTVIYSPYSASTSASTIVPGQLPPDTGGQVVAARSVSITKSKAAPIQWTGPEEASMRRGVSAERFRVDQVAQAIRVIRNEMEADLAALHIYMSRAYGTAGSNPFASDLTGATGVRQILVDNGAGESGLELVMNTTAGAALRNQGIISKVNESGSTDVLRRGVLLDLFGLSLRESAQIATATAGTGDSATTDSTGYAIGATTITLASAGTGTILAGDVVTFAGDSNKYIVATGDSDVSNGGTIVLQAPGLRQAIAAAPTAITVGATSVRNLAFARSAIILGTALPPLPADGDSGAHEVIVDPVTGIAFRLSRYPQYHQNHYEISASWGCGVIKPEHTAVLLG